MSDHAEPLNLWRNDHAERLNVWHLDLAIVADAIDHVLGCIEEPMGLSATAHVLKNRLVELVENCPFPDGGVSS